jgi:hypothetical protein
MHIYLLVNLFIFILLGLKKIKLYFSLYSILVYLVLFLLFLFTLYKNIYTCHFFFFFYFAVTHPHPKDTY